MTTLYLTEPGTTVSYSNQVLTVTQKEKTTPCRLAEIHLVVVLPGIQLSHSAISAFFDNGIETIFLRRDGRFRGRLQGQFATNPTIRLAQYQKVNTTFGRALAQKLVFGKVCNQKVLLQQRNRKSRGRISQLTEAVDILSAYQQQLKASDTPLQEDEIMGIEGICARTYYQALRHWFPEKWGFTGRNRRPPRDPINALLSWGYGVLLARVFAACVQGGLDPYLGFFHAIAPHRPNMVLDLMEEFRPVIVDRATIRLLEADVLTWEDFEPSPDGAGIWLGQTAKKLFLAQLEQQFQTKYRYPPQNQRRLALSQILLEQARWIGQCLASSELDYEAFVLR